MKFLASNLLSHKGRGEIVDLIEELKEELSWEATGK